MVLLDGQRTSPVLPSLSTHCGANAAGGMCRNTWQTNCNAGTNLVIPRHEKKVPGRECLEVGDVCSVHEAIHLFRAGVPRCPGCWSSRATPDPGCRRVVGGM
ncbi:MAG TPA: hypothetical protein PKM87_06985 [Methanolinea sp.]|nr:hypothetical protein [Methanolinea sp.]